MFRSSLAFLLIFLTLIAGSSKFFIYAEFTMNQQEIAAKFCVNKDKPQLHCNGKCYLKKKIKEAEEKERNQEQRNQKDRFQEALVTQKIRLSAPAGFEIPSAPVELKFMLSERANAIFHPPQA